MYTETTYKTTEHIKNIMNKVNMKDLFYVFLLPVWNWNNEEKLL